MNQTTTSWLGTLNEWVASTASMLLGILPAALSAIATLTIGWLVARVVRTLVRRLWNGVNRLGERLFRTGSLASARLSAPMIELIADIAHWLVIFIAFTIAMRVAGFTAISGWLNQIVLHLPNLIVGFLIIGVGYIASVYVGKLVDAGTTPTGTGERHILGRLTQALLFIATLIIGLDQFGVKVTFLIALLTVVAGAIVIGFSLAFGFGSRAHVANLIAARTAQTTLRPGATIRIGDVEGSVLEISPSHVVLDTETGRTLIPACLFDETVVHILTTAEEPTRG